MIAQTAILILSAAALWLLSARHAGRWGWIVGLASQPFWLWETYHAAQWGMFANALAFTVLYARGLVNHWQDEATKTPRDLPAITHRAYQALLATEGIAAAREYLQWLTVSVCGQEWIGDDGQPEATPFDGTVK